METQGSNPSVSLASFEVLCTPLTLLKMETKVPVLVALMNYSEIEIINGKNALKSLWVVGRWSWGVIIPSNFRNLMDS